MAARRYTGMKVTLAVSAASLTLGAAAFLQKTGETASLASEPIAPAVPGVAQTAAQAPSAATSSPTKVAQPTARKSRGS